MQSALFADTVESIAANVRRLRLRRQITQEGLAELASVDLSYLQRVERAEANLSIQILVALAEALDVRPAILLRSARLAPTRLGRPRKR